MPDLGAFRDEMETLAEAIARKGLASQVEPTLFMLKPGQDLDIVGLELESDYERTARLYVLAHEPVYACLAAELQTEVGDVLLASGESAAGELVDFLWDIHYDDDHRRTGLERALERTLLRMGPAPWHPLFVVDDWLRNLEQRAATDDLDDDELRTLAVDTLSPDEVRRTVRRMLALRLASFETPADTEQLQRLIVEGGLDAAPRDC